MNDWKEKIAFKGDKILWYIVIMLMIASVMVVYSSTGRLAYNEKAGNTFFYLIKQLFLIGGCNEPKLVEHHGHHEVDGRM